MQKSLLLSLAIGLTLIAPVSAESESADVVVYGATPAGVAAAVHAARDGVSVLLLEETHHIGGMTSGGLSNTDFQTFESLGGFFREFMRRVEAHYVETYGPDSKQVRYCAFGAYYEPGVARMIFEKMLAEAGVKVRLNRQLTGVEVDGRRVVSARFAASDSSAGYPQPIAGDPLDVRGRVFIDATYEGDLMAAAGVRYTIGVEGRDVYGESAAPEKTTDHVQAYNFRVTLSKDPDNRRPIPKPEGYDRERYAVLIRLGEARKLTKLDDITRGTNRQIPNEKADFNDRSRAPLSLRILEETDDWPAGDPATRARIFDIARDKVFGLFWFIQNDAEFAEVAPHIVAEAAPWGLPRDEFEASGNFPPVLYVREGRRMVGAFVLTERDVKAAKGSHRTPPLHDAVAIGDYPFSSHGTHRSADGAIVGYLEGGKTPFSVPYRVMVPAERDNLLVPVAASLSHLAFCRVRMEPVWSSMGQAAGIAAAQAVERDVAAQDVDVTRVQLRLHDTGGKTCYVSDVPVDSPYFAAVQFFGNRGFFQKLDETGAGPGGPIGARVKVPAQWRRDVWDHHAVKPDTAIDTPLAADWLERFAELYPKIATDDIDPAASRTRGELLNALNRRVRSSLD